MKRLWPISRNCSSICLEDWVKSQYPVSGPALESGISQHHFLDSETLCVISAYILTNIHICVVRTRTWPFQPQPLRQLSILSTDQSERTRVTASVAMVTCWGPRRAIINHELIMLWLSSSTWSARENLFRVLGALLYTCTNDAERERTGNTSACLLEERAVTPPYSTRIRPTISSEAKCISPHQLASRLPHFVTMNDRRRFTPHVLVTLSETGRPLLVDPAYTVGFPINISFDTVGSLLVIKWPTSL